MRLTPARMCLSESARRASLLRLSSFTSRTPRNYSSGFRHPVAVVAIQTVMLTLHPSSTSLRSPRCSCWRLQMDPAVPLTYQVGTRSTVTVNSAEPGLILASNLPVTTPFSFTLNDNGVQDFDETGIDQFSFDFFRAWVTEEVIDPDDFQHRNIVATLDLTTPGPSVITGSAASRKGTFFSTVSLGLERVRLQAISYGTIRPDLCRQRPNVYDRFERCDF